MSLDPATTAVAVKFLGEMAQIVAKEVRDKLSVTDEQNNTDALIEKIERQYQAQQKYQDAELVKEKDELIQSIKAMQTEIGVYVPPDEQEALIEENKKILIIALRAENKFDLTTTELRRTIIQSRINRYRDLETEVQKARNRIRGIGNLLLASFILIIICSIGLPLISPIKSDDFLTMLRQPSIIGIPNGVIIWSLVGSLVGTLYHFNEYADAEFQDSLRWATTRPIMGIAMGIVLYLSVSIGFTVILDEQSQTSLQTPELIYLVSFIGGLSDTLVRRVLGQLAQRFGAKEGDSISSRSKSINERIIEEELVKQLIAQLIEAQTANLTKAQETQAETTKPTSPTKTQTDEIVDANSKSPDETTTIAETPTNETAGITFVEKTEDKEDSSDEESAE